MESEKPRLMKSGLPKGSTVGYIKGKSCGRRKHNLVVARAGTYAICTKCHLRLVLEAEKPGGNGNEEMDNSI